MFTTPLDIWTLRESQKKGGLQPRGDTGFEETIKNLQTFSFLHPGAGEEVLPWSGANHHHQTARWTTFISIPLLLLCLLFPPLISQISVLISLLVSYLLTVLPFHPSAAKVKEPGNGSSCELASLFIILCTLKHLHGILYQLEEILILFQKANLLVRRQREMVAR